jgi:hypothetical protein
VEEVRLREEERKKDRKKGTNYATKIFLGDADSCLGNKNFPE